MCDTLGGRVKARRVELGISQTDLAIALGLTSSQKSRISDWENNKRKIPIDDIEQIAQVLRTTPEALLGYEGKSVPGTATPALVLSKHEYNMVSTYRSLDKYGKNMVDAALRIEYERCTDNSSDTEPYADDEILVRAAHRATRSIDQLNDPDSL